MLRRVHIARLAFTHSPERERWLLQFAEKKTDSKESVMRNRTINRPAPANTTIEGGQRFTREQATKLGILQATNPEEQRIFLKENSRTLEQNFGDIVGSVDLNNDEEVAAMIELIRDQAIRELNIESVEKQKFLQDLAGLDTETSSEEDIDTFVEGYKDIIDRYIELNEDRFHTINSLQGIFTYHNEFPQKIEKRIVGIKQDHLFGEAFKKKYLTLAKGKQAYKEYLAADDNEKTLYRFPSAFRVGNRTIFNIEHSDFRDAQYGATRRARAVVHETTHALLALDKVDLEKIQSLIRSQGHWEEIKNAVIGVRTYDTAIFEDDTKSAREYVTSEAIAIYVADKLHGAYENDIRGDRQKPVHDIMQKILDEGQNNTYLRKIIDGVTKRVQTEVDSNDFIGKLETAVQENEQTNIDLQNIESNFGDSRIEANTAEGKALIDEELKNEENKEPPSPETLLDEIRETRQQVENLHKEYPPVLALLQAQDINDDQRKENASIFAQNIEFLNEELNDLTMAEKMADTLRRWSLPENEGGLSLEEKNDFAETHLVHNPYHGLKSVNASTIIAADTTTKESRNSALLGLNTAVKNIKAPLETLQKTIDSAKGIEIKHSNEQQGSMWGVIKENFFSENGYIMWRTPRNLIHIFKTFKDAIVENYTSNEKVKENNDAKKIADSFSIFKPIRHTIKKLARSSNSEESDKFLDYIKKEGFTYDELFGPDGEGNSGGLLYDNRHNFNRTKAVLEYAADKAWLYKLDRFNGHSVYGVDYIKQEGHESFQELVQKNEQGKKHEIDHGYEKIDKDADVPPIIDVLIHELEEKKIFAAVGVLKRLQEKAKYSHSNAWGAVTFINAMRGLHDHHPGKVEKLLKVMDKGALDQIGNIGIGQSAWTLTMFKTLRDQLESWKNGGPFVTEKNYLARAIKMIEDKFDSKHIKFKKQKDKDEAIAMILAGKTYKDESTGLVISIFNSEFKYYRDYWNKASTTTSAKDSDDDWFNPENGGADILLLGKAGLLEIAGRQSQGPFVHGTKAPNYFAQVFMRDNDLETHGLQDAKNNFRNEMREKVNSYSYQLQAAGKDQFPLDTTLSYTKPEIPSNANILMELLNRDMISEKAYRELLESISANNKPRIPDIHKQRYKQMTGKEYLAK